MIFKVTSNPNLSESQWLELGGHQEALGDRKRGSCFPVVTLALPEPEDGKDSLLPLLKAISSWAWEREVGAKFPLQL